MKLEVYNEPSLETEEPVRLKLKLNGGCVMLQAVNGNGSVRLNCNLLKFHPDGTISRCLGADPTLGFGLDVKGRLVIE